MSTFGSHEPTIRRLTAAIQTTRVAMIAQRIIYEQQFEQYTATQQKVDRIFQKYWPPIASIVVNNVTHKNMAYAEQKALYDAQIAFGVAVAAHNNAEKALADHLKSEAVASLSKPANLVQDQLSELHDLWKTTFGDRLKRRGTNKTFSLDEEIFDTPGWVLGDNPQVTVVSDDELLDIPEGTQVHTPFGVVSFPEDIEAASSVTLANKAGITTDPMKVKRYIIKEGNHSYVMEKPI